MKTALLFVALCLSAGPAFAQDEILASYLQGGRTALIQGEYSKAESLFRSAISEIDLRHTFATRLRGQGVHELDIMQLLGHSSLGVTAGYAHGMPTVIQSAVDKLADSKGEVVQFAKAS